MSEFSLTIEGLSAQKAELSDADAELLKQAGKAASSAYAPYSEFKVGSAVRLENGETVIGSNQENAAYPAGLCAERVALFAASTNNPNVPVSTIAVTVKADNSHLNGPLTPCGGCRQVIMEYQNRQQSPIRLILAGKDDTVWIFEDAAVLLPFAFEGESLKNS